MNCDKVQNEFPLFFYGELSPEDEQAIQDHLDACAGCRKAFEAEKALHRLLDRRERMPSPELLAACRRDLGGQLRSPSSARSWWRAMREGFRLSPAFVRPAGALALIALGFVAARLTAPSQANWPRESPESVITRVRNIQADPSGRIQIVVDETRQRLFTGPAEDRRINGLLLAAARESSDPGLRGDSVEILKSRPGSLEVRRALQQALEHDPNPGVRLKALEGLKSFAGDAEVRSLLAQTLLRDDNSGVRAQTIDLLVQQKEDSLVGVFQELVGKEDNGYVRLRCQRALQEMKASVGTF